ncbi:hypothetical protein CWATWH0401_2259 [Crocosphaera watsonii WH 0401]|uniref:Uncharacterized protein n=1 Tax=Crocosphaera watsonii WH 0401 TaxID=555881 RepID=T2JEH2_CROWT|nr:hypothetical protein CWATWH0401_2259 [Crocosphaera watsonii WH 0401]
MVNYYSSRFVQIISHTIITPLIKSSLLISKAFNTLSWCAFLSGLRIRRVAPLFILGRLKFSITLVIPLINAFKSFPINQKLMPLSVKTSSQIINPQINSHRFVRSNRCLYFFILINVLDLKPSRRVFWMYSYLLNIFIFQSFRELDLNLTVLLIKLSRHGNSKHPIFDFDSRNNQREISVFRQVFRKLWFLVTASYANSLKQTQERPHTSIHHLNSLLRDIGVQKSIVLVRLTNMVVRFVGQPFSFYKEILPTFVQGHIKKIFAQTTQYSQGFKFLLAKSSKLILLSGVHI